MSATLKWAHAVNTLAVLAFLAGSAVAQTNDLQFSRRVVSGAVVDLSPLAQWKSNPSGERPLKAWKQITGTKTGETAYGWTVDIQTENGLTRRAILRNPPIQAWQEFQQAKTNYTALAQQLDQFEQDQTGSVEDIFTAGRRAGTVQARVSDYERAVADAHVRGWRNPCIRTLRALDSSRDELQALRQRSQQLYRTYENSRTNLLTIKEEIQMLQMKGKLTGEFQVSCFALETGQNLQGLAVYDRGTTLR